LSLDPFLVLLVLLSALLHVAWNMSVRISGDRFLTFGLILSLVAVVGVVLAAVVPVPAPASWPYLVASGAAHVAYIVFLTLAYEHGALNLVYPLARGSNPLFVALLAALAVGEIPSTGGLAGIALISTGIIGLTFAGGRLTGDTLKPVVYALGTGLLIASYTVIDGIGIRLAGTDIGYYAWHNITHALPYVAGLILWRRGEFLSFLKENWKPGLLSGLAATIGYGIILYALARGAMAYVAALRETSVLIAALVGTLVLKEGLGGWRIAAASLVLVGLVMLQVLG
jgi:drug/metabolite transporter (DMT)-like permease